RECRRQRRARERRRDRDEHRETVPGQQQFSGVGPDGAERYGQFRGQLQTGGGKKQCRAAVSEPIIGEPRVAGCPGPGSDRPLDGPALIIVAVGGALASAEVTRGEHSIANLTPGNPDPTRLTPEEQQPRPVHYVPDRATRAEQLAHKGSLRS